MCETCGDKGYVLSDVDDPSVVGVATALSAAGLVAVVPCPDCAGPSDG